MTTPTVDIAEFDQDVIDVGHGATIFPMRHAHITLEGVFGTDLDVVNAAKVSFKKYAPEMSEDEIGILKYLMRNRHGTPFEHNYLRFNVRAPMYVFYEWHRHRVGHSYNEESARYSVIQDDFIEFLPEEVREQHGKPGRYHFEEIEDKAMAQDSSDKMALAQNFAFRTYNELLEAGVAKEQARVVLPSGTMKQMIWSCNLRSLMAFLSLRMDNNAQKEIRMFAHAAFKLAFDHFPITLGAFQESGWVAP